MADVKTREASLITFLACAANITLLGIGGAFWGLLIGMAAYALLNGRLPRREAVVIPTADAVVTTKGVTH
jgi:benzoate membrane transport protein